MRAIQFLAILFTLTAVNAADSPAPVRTPPVAVFIKAEKRTPDITEATARLFRGTNALRVGDGKMALQASPELTAAAVSFAVFMADTERYGHEADGMIPADRAKKAGYDACIVAENLAYQYLSTGFTTDELVAALLEGWMDSRGHRANLLDADVTQLGVAIARSKKSGKYYAVQLFGRPRSLEIAFTVRNDTGQPLRYGFASKDMSLPARTTVTHSLCRSAQLKFDWPGRQPGTTLEAQNGQSYVISRAQDGTFRVVKNP